MRIHTLALAAAAATLCLSSCKKDDKTSATTTSAPAQSQQQMSDVNDAKGEHDQINSDVNDAVSNFASFEGGRVGLENGISKPICGCTIDSSQLGQKILILNFDGQTSCSTPSRTRGGQIVLQLVHGRYWAGQNAMLKITLNNYKVTRQSDNRSVTFNGVKYLTNVRGHRWLAVLAGTDSIQYKERGQGITALFERNGQERGMHTFSMARTSNAKYITQGSEIIRVQFRATGDTIINSLSSVDTWGTNRYDSSFVTQFTTPIVSNSYCGFNRPVAGQIVSQSGRNTLTMTLGVGTDGNAHTGDCGYGWKLSWSLANGQSGSTIISY